MDRGGVKKLRRDAFLSAAVNGELNLLKELVAKYDDGRGTANTVLSVKDDNGVGVIHFAALKGKISVLDYLIEELGIDVNLKDGTCESPLMHATEDGNRNTVEYLLGKGADPKTSNTYGYTPLHCAAEKGYTEILNLLLSRGVEVNACSKLGTPLERAAGEGQLEEIRILLDHNADRNLFCSHMFTPLTVSIISGLPQSLQCVELLLEAGADPNGGTHDLTPLVAAAATDVVASAVEGLTAIIKCLIQAGADPDVTNSFGLTSLELAALNGYHNMAEILFPVTSRIPGYSDWSFGGVIRHVNSDEAKEQRKLKAKQQFHEVKLSGADAFKKQDYFRAMVCYSKAIQIDPYDANVLSNRSMCWARIQDGEKALEDASACLLLRPDWPKAYYRAGVAFHLLKRYSDAQKAFLDGLKLNPNSQELKDAYRESVEAQLNNL